MGIESSSGKENLTYPHTPGKEKEAFNYINQFIEQNQINNTTDKIQDVRIKTCCS